MNKNVNENNYINDDNAGYGNYIEYTNPDIVSDNGNSRSKARSDHSDHTGNEVADGANEKSRNSVFINIPSVLDGEITDGERVDSVRYYDYTDRWTGNSEKLARVTLPRGTMYNGMDLSYYQLTVKASQVDPGGQKYENMHAVSLPRQNSQGEPWTVNLKRDFSRRDESSGKLINDVHKSKITSEDLKAACDTQMNLNNVYVVVPSKISKNTESIRYFESKDKKTGESIKMANVTLPKGTNHDGMDLSYYQFTVKATQVDPGGQKYESTHSIRFPERNSYGDPWTVDLRRDFGFHEPKSQNWISNVSEHRMTSKELKTVCREQYDHYIKYRSRSQNIQNAEQVGSKDEKCAEKRQSVVDQVKNTASESHAEKKYTYNTDKAER